MKIFAAVIYVWVLVGIGFIGYDGISTILNGTVDAGDIGLCLLFSLWIFFVFCISTLLLLIVLVKD